MKHLAWLLCVLFSSNALAAGEVEIPLLAETALIRAAIGTALELDENGQSILGDEVCNRLELSDLAVVPEEDLLAVSMAMNATTGANVLGACRGPGPWEGRLAMRLTPQVMESGLAIEFVPDSVELLRPDGSTSMLSAPAEILANALVIPRMNSVQIDLAGPLNGLDELIVQLLGPGRAQGGEEPLIQRTRITRLETEENGIRAWLAFQVSTVASAEPAAPTDPADAVTPAEPTDPANPVASTEPSDPVDPDGVASADPADPVNPADTVAAAGQANPADPDTPADPADPVDSAAAADSDDPVASADPAASAAPSDSVASADPADPANQVPEPALDATEAAQWQTIEDEFDGFLTTIISTLAHSTESYELRTELLATLLDARHAIAEALLVDDPAADPVRELFLTTWDRLRPLLGELDSLQTPGMDVDFRLAAFMAGGDALRALDALGPDYGFEITRDGLRRLARLLLSESAPPSFTPLPLEVDPEFRELFGLESSDEPVSAIVELMHQIAGALRSAGSWLLPTAHASNTPPAEALKGLVPRLAILDDYLDLVASLLEQQSSAWLAANDSLPDRMKARLDPLVRATAWKESCWRQLSGSTSNPQVLRSSVGAVGMMQINGRVWRSVYDQDRLSDEVDYNVNAGIEILTHYMVDYAIRRGEHEQPGGDDNLIKATYAAYNGGPSQLSRYRRQDTPARLRAIDNEFWRHYTSIKADQWPEISSCYAVGD